MYIKEEISLRDFDFWQGAKDHRHMFTEEELDQIESCLEDVYCDRELLTDTEINDLFWFNFEFVCELLGYTYDSNTDTIYRYTCSECGIHIKDDNDLCEDCKEKTKND